MNIIFFPNFLISHEFLNNRWLRKRYKIAKMFLFKCIKTSNAPHKCLNIQPLMYHWIAKEKSQKIEGRKLMNRSKWEMQNYRNSQTN